jgi:hypothetical protein
MMMVTSTIYGGCVVFVCTQMFERELASARRVTPSEQLARSRIVISGLPGLPHGDMCRLYDFAIEAKCSV